MGTRFNNRKSLSLGFGDGSESTSRSRSVPCVALHPCNNAADSWKYWNLRTGAHVRKSNWKQMTTTQAIIDMVNEMHFRRRTEPHTSTWSS
jgi:hypothetical protein